MALSEDNVAISEEDLLRQRKCHIWHNKPRAAQLLREVCDVTLTKLNDVCLGHSDHNIKVARRWNRKGATYFAYRKYITAHKEHIASDNAFESSGSAKGRYTPGGP
eukprot:5234085-Pyramimonas_sp.AAC.3